MPSDRPVGTIIVGAGEAGQLLARGMDRQESLAINILGFVDDDVSKKKATVAGYPVLGSISELAAIVNKYNAKEILVALPSQRGLKIREILANTAGMRLSYRILPRLSEVLLQDAKEDYLKHIRKLRVEDLLGGEILKADQRGIAEYVNGKVLLITGAAGSIGSELSRQLAAYNPQKIVFYDWWENGMFELRNQLLESYDESKFEFIIGDIKDRTKLDAVLKKFTPHTVFHAAAYKHVPLMEGTNAAEAIKNNTFGTKIVAELSIANHVNKFILVSTDKAVNPTNVMGASKRAAEQVVHVLAESQDETIFCVVRFGNVINSNGSVIPYFKRQIANGGPVTVTHHEITRFFMTIPEAVHLILQAWTIGANNDLFVLDMGESVRIYELAHSLIALEGYIPETEIRIEVVGLRPGEKLYEEVLMDEEGLDATTIKKVFRTKNFMNFDKDHFLDELQLLLDSFESKNHESKHVKSSLQKMVSTYKPKQN